ncbi:hypothetical protein EI427_18015 [Flammeovirga pectinis]|uniref:Uncharacterized protein n=1 Tax=Flammeovirga pectinis TaxID=2494373 RepID=A0A3S9P7D0_9BACT|nr:hypothetical protein [Flammeovirga pectinis]AZQ64054.1 hypothetical protein EI427_18015 [Flammeovirga pectinis]
MIKKLLISITFLCVTMSFTQANIVEEDKPLSKNTQELSEALTHAAEDDYEVYAKSAQIIVNWNTDLETAKEWIDTSLEIEENALAYEVLGDFYLHQGNNEMAIDSYEKSLSIVMFDADATLEARVQRKILAFNR